MTTKSKKLLDVLDEARRTLERFTLGPRASIFPDPGVDDVFKWYSNAARDTVTYCISYRSWGVEPDTWSFNAYPKRFEFHYDGCADLTKSGDPLDIKPLFLSARMYFDPKPDVHDELERLEREAKFYRDAAELMSRELYRQHVRAEAAADKEQQS